MLEAGGTLIAVIQISQPLGGLFNQQLTLLRQTHCPCKSPADTPRAVLVFNYVSIVLSFLVKPLK